MFLLERMPVETTELKSKKDFRGDFFDLKQAIHFDPETGLYSYDYADLTPEVKAALERVILQRISSAKFAEVEEALKKLKSSPPGSKGPPPPPKEKGEIAKAIEAYEAQYKKEADVLEPLWIKKYNGEELTPEEEKIIDEQSERLTIVRRQIIGTKSKEQYNSLEDRLNEGEKLSEENQTTHDEMEKAMLAFETYDDLVTKYKIPFEENLAFTKAWTTLVPLELSDAVRETYDLEKATEEEKEELEKNKEAMEAFETVASFKTKTGISDDDVKELIRVIDILDSAPDTLWLEKGVEKIVMNTREYKNAKALVQQIEGTPEDKRTEQQKKNLANAKVKIEKYEKKHPPQPKNNGEEGKEDEEEGKEEEENVEVGEVFANEPKKGGTRGQKRKKLTHSTRKLKK